MTEPIPVTSREHLDRLHCANPNCDHTQHRELFLHSRCHPKVGLAASYAAGILTICCAACDKFIVAVEVK